MNKSQMTAMSKTYNLRIRSRDSPSPSEPVWRKPEQFSDLPPRVCKFQSLNCMSPICGRDDRQSDDIFQYVDDDDGTFTGLQDGWWGQWTKWWRWWERGRTWKRLKRKIWNLLLCVAFIVPKLKSLMALMDLKTWLGRMLALKSDNLCWDQHLVIF